MGRVIGERVVLREFRSEDLSAMRAWVNDPDVTRFLSGAYSLRPQTWEQTEDNLRAMLTGDAGGVNMVIAERESLAYLGQVSLFMIDYTARKCEMAIVLSAKNIGRGYGTEALRLILRYAFDQMNMNRVFLTAHARNARAIHVYEKVGFVHEGLARQDRYVDGRYEDVALMGILREEYEANVRGQASAAARVPD